MANKSDVKNKNSKALTPKVKDETTSPPMQSFSVWIKLAMVLIVIIVVFGLLVFDQPNEFTVERDIVIHAPTSKVFNLVNNLHYWSMWSSWDEKDPTIERTFDKPDSGVGADCYWIGDDQVGQGKMIITESEKNLHVAVEEDFTRPTIAKNALYFDMSQNENDTMLKWRTLGDNSLADKIADVFGKGDQTLGNGMQTSLEELKAVVESNGVKKLGNTQTLTSRVEKKH